MRNFSFTLRVLAPSVLICLLAACGNGDEQKTGQKPAPEIAVLTVQPSTSHLKSYYPAIIKGKTDIDIRPQVSGFITKVHVDEGQQVRKGQVLFTLDQVTFQAAVNQATAAVNSAQVNVENAQLTADNQKRLYDKNIISESQWLVAQNQLSTAKAQLQQAQAALESAKKNLSYTIITSPSAGVVGSIPNREGSLASPSSAQPLTTVSDNSEIYAYFSLNEKDILELTDHGAQSLEYSISHMPALELQLANGDIYPTKGKVATVSGVIDHNTGAASVRALFNNENGMLRSGNTGQVIIPIVTENVIQIPQKSTYELQDRRYVYIIDDSCRAVSTPITILENNDGQSYVVTSGLEPGNTIAVEGIGTLVKEGVKIKPKYE